MTTEEIKALLNLDTTINTTAEDLSRLAKSTSISVRVSVGGNFHHINISRVEGLQDKIHEIIEYGLQELYDELVRTKQQLVLCKEGHATNFTPIDILKNGE